MFLVSSIMDCKEQHCIQAGQLHLSYGGDDVIIEIT